MPITVSEIAGRQSAYQFLNGLYELQDTITHDGLSDLMERSELSDDLFSQLQSSGLVLSTEHGFHMSSLGTKVTLLLKAINGDMDLQESFSKLRYMYPELQSYQLIIEDITGYFIDSLVMQPNFIRLYICSPWIRLYDPDYIYTLEEAVRKARQVYDGVQIFVVTLPLERYGDPKAVKSLKSLRLLGADIVKNKRLHAKLYISEPGPLGGSYYAIFGSENLTGRRNRELGIRIENDNEILSRLAAFFRETRDESEILEVF